MYAAEQGHRVAVKVLLDHGATFEWNKDFPDRMPPIHAFAAFGDEMAVRICIEHGTDLDTVASKELVPLHLAASRNQHVVVHLLLDAGANCDARDGDKRTSLMRAARNGYSAVVKVLLDFGAEVECKDREGASALRLAAVASNSDVAKMLLDAGASSDDATALWFAASWGNETAVRLLLYRGVPVDIALPKTGTALSCAVTGGHNNVVQLLIARGAKIEAIANASDFAGGKKIIHVITSKFHYTETFEHMIQLCCNAGVGVNAVDDRGRTAVHAAILHAPAYAPEHAASQIQVLVDHGAKFDTEDKHGLTPLHYAVQTSHGDALVRVLLGLGARAGARDHEGCTPLHLGVTTCSRDSLRLLLDHGADINARDDEGSTPLNYAHLVRFGPIDFLTERGAVEGRRFETRGILKRFVHSTQSRFRRSQDSFDTSEDDE